MSIESKPRQNIESNPRNVEKNKEEGFRINQPVIVRPQILSEEKIKISQGVNEGVIEEINEKEKTAKVKLEYLGTVEVPLEDLTKKY
jgi:hypothetical protein